MGKEIERLSIAVGADSSALAGAMGPIGGLVGKLTGMFSGAGAAIAAGIGGAAIAIGAFAVKSAKDIEAGTHKIRTGTGATGKALADLSGSMKNVGKDVPESFEEVGGAIADLNTRLGLTGKPLEDLTTKMMNLGRITGEDVPALIASTTRVFGDWAVATEDQSAALDYLFNVSQSTGISVGSLSEKLVKFGAPLRQLGFDMETSAALLGKFEKEGVNVDLVMGSMRIALGKMARAGEEPIETFRRVTEQIKSTGSAGEANALALELFGARAGPDMAASIREGRFEIDDLMGTLAGSGETINAAAGDTLKLGDRLKILGNNAKVIAEPLGKGILVALEWAVKGITKAIRWISELVTKIRTAGGGFKTARDIISKVFSSIRSVISTAVKIITGLWDRFGKQIVNQIKTSFAFIWNIIKAAFKVIQGIFNVFKGIFTGDWSLFWKGIKAIFGGIWNAIKAVFSAVWNTIKNIAQAVWNAISGVAKAIWNGIKAYFEFWLKAAKTVFTTVWNAIKAVITGIWDGIKKVASVVWEGIKKVIWDPVKWAWDKIVGAWNAIRDFIVGIWDGIKDTASSVWGGISNAVARIWDGIKDTWSRVWDGITGVVKKAVNGIIKGVNGAIRGMNIINPFKDIPKIPEWKDMGGPILGSGRVLVDAEPGEFMMRKAAVGRYGSAFMNAVNAGTYDPTAGGGVTVYATFNSVSPDYDSDRMVELTANKIARQGRHTARIMRRGR